jgi:acyl carrier protein
LSTDEITQGVRELVARRARVPVEDSPAGTPLSELGVDSLGVVALIVDLEEHFAVRLPAGMVSHDVFHSVDTIAGAVRTLVEQR